MCSYYSVFIFQQYSKQNQFFLKGDKIFKYIFELSSFNHTKAYRTRSDDICLYYPPRCFTQSEKYPNTKPN